MRRTHESRPREVITLELRGKPLYYWLPFFLIATFAVTGCAPETGRVQTAPSGEALFLRHCTGCHPDGKNLIYPPKDLLRMTLAANGITQPEKIVAVMRKPGRGMPRFDRTVISDDEAARIAVYVMAAFR